MKTVTRKELRPLVPLKEVDPADLKDPETPFLILDVN
jgi:hypothetical protein